MPTPPLIASLARSLGLTAPQPLPAPAACDPIPAPALRTSRIDGSKTVEHFMNNHRRTQTTGRKGLSANAPAMPATPARHAGHRPRITTGQRLAQALFECAGPQARLVRHGETQWASATFTGSRHTFVLRFFDMAGIAAAEKLGEAIDHDAITIPGALIAELAVTRLDQRLLPDAMVELEIAALLLDQ